MKRIHFILAFIGTIFIGLTYGQDTIEYRQKNAALFSNNYTFYRLNKTDKNGIFKQTTFTDDGQSWFGQGIFKEKRRCIVLTFDTTKFNHRVEFKTKENNKDILNIKWFDWWGEPQEFFNIKYKDTTSNNKIYQTNWVKGYVEIPLTELQDKNLSLYVFNSNRKILDFKVPEGINEISIFANDTMRIHTHNKTKEKLRKRKNGFITLGMWTKGKKTLFVKREK